MISARMALYYRRKKHGMCVSCGAPAIPGKTKCDICAAYDRECMKARYAAMTPEQKRRKIEKDKKWLSEHPERAAEYSRRKPEYNRRYRNG